MPDERRGWAIGIFSTGGTTLLILGPLIGAAILTLGDWRWLFVINLPVLIFALVEVICISRPFLHHGLGTSVLTAGLVLALTGMFTPLLSTRTGALADRWGARTLVLPGLAVACAGLAGRD